MGSGGEKAKVLLSFLNSLDSIALLLRAAPNQGDRKRVSVLIPEEILEAVICFKATKLHHAFQDLDIPYWLPLFCYRPTTINSLPVGIICYPKRKGKKIKLLWAFLALPI